MNHIEFPGLGKPYPEPSADARRVARACRDQFVALQLEGFTEHQALHIIGVMVAAANQKDGGQ